MALVKKVVPTPKQKQRTYFSDFKTVFSTARGDLERVTNEESVRQSLHNLFLTVEGERFFSNYGSGLRRLLFEPISPQTEATLENMVRLAIQNYEPRANIVDLRIIGSEEDDAYLITLTVSLINNNDPVQMDFILNRVR